MKSLIHFLPLAAACLLFLGLPQASAQTTLYWDGDGSGPVGGGTGTWNTTDTRWSTAPDGVVYQAWDNTAPVDDAHFTSEAGTVTLGTDITARSLAFTVTDYTLAGAQTLTFDGGTGLIDTGSGNQFVGVAIAGDDGLTKTGSGALILTGTNTYTGGTTISEGILFIANTLLSGDYAIAENANLYLDLTANHTYSGQLAGAGGLTLLYTGGDTAGTLTLDGNNTLTGGITLLGGTLALGSANAIGSAPGSTLSFSGGALQYSAANTTDYSARFSNAASQSYRIDTNGQDVILASDLTSTDGSLTKLGTGTLTLAGANTYSGTTTISAGTLQGTTASLPGTILNNATLTFDQDTDGTFAGLIAGIGDLTKTGTGTLTLAAANFFTGSTTITAGILRLGDALALQYSTLVAPASIDGFSFGTQTAATLGGLSGSNDLALTNESTDAVALTVGNNNTDTNYSGILSGTGSLLKTGSATFTLSGANTFSGTTTLNLGTLALGHELALQNSTVSISVADGLSFGGLTAATLGGLSGNDALALTNNADAAVALTVGNNDDDTTYFGALTGTGALIKSGDGTFTLNGANTYSGGTTINSGTLRTSADSLPGDLTNYAALVFDFGGGTYSGTIDGTGTLEKTGIGNLTLSGANTYTGDTILTNGTLTLGHALALQGSTLVHAATGNLSFGTLTTATLGGLSGDQDLALANNLSNAVALSVGNNDADTNYSGVLSGAGALKKTGNGNFTLSGANTYEGGTTVGHGTLTMGHASALGSGQISINAGAVLESAAFGFDLAQISGPGTLTGTGAYSYNSASDTALATALGGTGATVTKTGTGTLTLSGDNTYTGTTTVSAGTLHFATQSSLYDNTPASWTAANLVVSSGATAAFNVGGTDEFTTADIATLAALGTGSGGFQDGAIIGLDTTNATGANFTHASVIADPNSGANVLSLTKLGDGTLTLSAANTYSGTTTISAGTLTLADALALQGSTLSYADAGSLSFGSLTAATLGGLSGSNALALTNGSSAAVALSVGNNDADTTYSGILSGPGSLIKTGSGALTLAGENTFSGTTTLTDGTLALGNEDALRQSTLVHSGSGVLSFGNLTTAALGGLSGSNDLALTNTSAAAVTLYVGYNHADTTYSGNLSGTGSLLKTGDGALALSGNNTFSGDIYLFGGTLALGSAGALGSTSPLFFNGGTLQFSAGNTTDYSGRFDSSSFAAYAFDTNGQDVTLASALSSADGSLTKSGAGTLTLSAANTFSGTTTITAGTLKLDHALALQSSTLTTPGSGDLSFGSLTAATLGGITGSNALVLTNSSSAALALTVGNNDADTVYAGDLSGSGSLIKTGDGTLVLTGDNTQLGGTTITAGGGILQIGNGGTTGSLAGAITNSARLTFNRSDSIAQSGVISGSGSLTQAGTGTLTLTGANTYTGATTVAAGTLQLSGAGSIADTSAVTVNSTGNFDLNDVSDTVRSIAGAGRITLGTATLTTNDLFNTTFSGDISGSGGVTKSGSGTLTLSGDNTYTGATTVSDGKLVVNGSASNSAFTINGGTLSGSGTIGTLTIASGGTLAPGNSPGTLSAGATTWEGGASFEWEVNDAEGIVSTNWDLLNITGGLTITANEANPFLINLVSLTAGNAAGLVPNFDADTDYSWVFVTTSSGITFDGGGSIVASFQINTAGFQNALNGTFALAQSGNDLNLTYTSAVPEPSAYAFIVGLLAIALAANRRRRV